MLYLIRLKKKKLKLNKTNVNKNIIKLNGIN